MLMSQVYPDYSPKQSIMRAPVIRVTIGDYLYRVPGFLESVNFTVDNNTPWEINLENDQSGNIAQLPQVVDVSISFKPILDVLPKRSTMSSVTSENYVSSTREVIETETITSNVAALIANVPKSSPDDPTTFIKPSFVEQNVTSRNATAADIARAVQSPAPPSPITRIPSTPNNIRTT
jgi:hypothetical protein